LSSLSWMPSTEERFATDAPLGRSRSCGCCPQGRWSSMRCCTVVSTSDSSTVGATALAGATGLRPPAARDCALTAASESRLPASWRRYRSPVEPWLPFAGRANKLDAAARWCGQPRLSDVTRDPLSCCTASCRPERRTWSCAGSRLLPAEYRPLVERRVGRSRFVLSASAAGAPTSSNVASRVLCQSSVRSSAAFCPAFAVRRRKSAISSSSVSPYPARSLFIEALIPE